MLVKSVKGYLLLSLLSVTPSVLAQVPEECLQLPERTEFCPNVLYKRSPVDVPQLNIRTNEMVCICMADFAELRIAASTEQGKIDQQVALSRAAFKLDMSEQDLLTLIRK